MKIALAIYAAVYVILAVVTITNDLRWKESAWDTASDSILLPLGLAGIALFGLEVNHPDMKTAWKLIAPIIVVGQVANNILGRYRAIAAGESDNDKHGIVVADVFSVLLLLPMFAINLAYAFRG